MSYRKLFLFFHYTCGISDTLEARVVRGHLHFNADFAKKYIEIVFCQRYAMLLNLEEDVSAKCFTWS